MLNGKTLRFYKDKNNFVIPNNTSQLFLINCTNITINNMDYYGSKDIISIHRGDLIVINNCTYNNCEGYAVRSVLCGNITFKNNTLFAFFSDRVWG